MFKIIRTSFNGRLLYFHEKATYVDVRLGSKCGFEGVQLKMNSFTICREDFGEGS